MADKVFEAAKQDEQDTAVVTTSAGKSGKGLAQVRAMFASGIPAAQEVAKVVRAHPGERDDIIKFLQQTAGNGYTNLVVKDA